MEETKCIGGLSDSMWGGQYHQQDRVYSMGQCALALPASIPEGSYKYMEIKKVDRNYEILPQTVRVRKYPIDQKALAETLRMHKSIGNNSIAEALNMPVTKVEHWFRTDSCGAVVDEDCWLALKELLGGGADLDAFDEAVMTFEERDGVFEKSERVYMPDKESPTITTQEDIKTIDIKVIGKMDNTTDNTFESANRVYGSDGISPTIPTSCGGGHTPKVMECVAMRGREDGQQLELRQDDCVNSITTVQKDNMVLESVIVDDTYKCRDERVYKEYAPSIRAEREGLKIVNVRQATKQGVIPCEVGGGGRSKLPRQQNKTRKSTRERTDMPDFDDGEHP